MRSIVEANTGLEVAAVISNRPDAPGLEWARAQGLAAEALDHKGFATREAFDSALAERIASHRADLVLLAGFMRIFTEGFIRRFPRRILNIHPSLLPAFPGLHTHRQALAAGVKVHGCTVHVVTPELDAGPIVIQAIVPVRDGDNPDTLAARVLRQEHVVYPRAVHWFLEGRLVIENGLVRVKGSDAQFLFSDSD
jgi:phosphoribosylglycinamide formyltransferase-1